MCQPMGLFEVILSIATVLFLLYVVGIVIVGFVVQLNSKKRRTPQQASENYFVRAGRAAWTEVDRGGLTLGGRLSLIVIAIILILLYEAIF